MNSSNTRLTLNSIKIDCIKSTGNFADRYSGMSDSPYN